MKILVVDDEKNIRWILEKAFLEKYYLVKTASNLKDAMEIINSDTIDVLFLDVKLPDGNGIDKIEEIKRISPDTQIIIITAHGSVEVAIEAMKRGAFEYLTKPFDINEAVLLAERAYKIVGMQEELTNLKNDINENRVQGDIIGNCKEIQEVAKTIGKVSGNNSNVLIIGESGTGKELVAKKIALNSLRKEKPFVIVNCAAMPSNLIESELFGYEKGSFTGAYKRKIGKFEFANGGIIFLDEIGELPQSLQVKLLRVLSGGEFERIGSRDTLKTDVRVISATNRNLKKEVESGNFREDLYYRLKVVEIHLPPLRIRGDDIFLLIDYFSEKYSKEFSSKKIFSFETKDILSKYIWPGNIRELENLIKRLFALTREPVIMPYHLPPEIIHYSKIQDSDNFEIEIRNKVKKLLIDNETGVYELLSGKFDNIVIDEVMKHTEGNQLKASKILGISRNTLRKKIEDMYLDT